MKKLYLYLILLILCFGANAQTEHYFGGINSSSGMFIQDRFRVTTHTSSPTVNDDVDLGYKEGNLWINTTGDSIFILQDPTNGAAVWHTINGIVNVGDSLAAGVGDSLWIASDGSFIVTTEGKVLIDSSVIITTAGGIDYAPGSDIDVDIMTVNVTGDPKQYWFESQGIFMYTSTVNGRAGIQATNGNDAILSLYEGATEKARIMYDGGLEVLRITVPGATDLMGIFPDGEFKYYNRGETNPTVIANTYSEWPSDANGAGTCSKFLETEDGTTIVLATTSLMTNLTLDSINADTTTSNYIRVNETIYPDANGGADIGESGLEFGDAHADSFFAVHYGGQSDFTIGKTGEVATFGSDTTALLGDLLLGTTTAVSGILDEDDMSSNSATDLATQQSVKTYVDNSVNVVIDYFFNNTLSDIGDIYYDMTNVGLGGIESTLDTPGLTASTDDQPLFNFATLLGEPGILSIPSGVIDIHFHAERTAGNSDVNIYAVIYKRASGGAETVIDTTELTGLVTSKTALNLHAYIGTDSALLVTDRIVVKFHANVGSGSGATVVLYQEGNTTSRLTIPTTTSILSQVFLRRDGTVPMTGDFDVGNNNIDSVGNMMADSLFGDGSNITGMPTDIADTLDYYSTITGFGFAIEHIDSLVTADTLPIFFVAPNWMSTYEVVDATVACRVIGTGTVTVMLVRDRGTDANVFSTGSTLTNQKWVNDETIDVTKNDINEGDIFFAVVTNVAGNAPKGLSITISIAKE